MTLIVEDGTARPDAESYMSVAGADAYHASRNNAAWAPLDTATKEANLRKATDYMQQVYAGLWAGTKRTNTQALDWPRQSVPIVDGPGAGAHLTSYYGFDIVPVEVQRACAELALKANAGPLIPDLSQAIKSKTVGQLSIVYQDYSTATKTYRAIDRLLGRFMAAQGGIRVLRA